jgi:dipeptidyl aminopeptidase/acylaminoacyl peptidase
MIAYLAPDQKGVLNVWIKDRSATQADQLLTNDQKRGIRSFFWGWDSKKIFYIQDRDGDENWHLYQTNLATKETRDLTPYDGAQASLLAYEPQFPDQMLVALNIRNPSLFDIYRIDLTDGSMKLEVENDFNVIEWLADHTLTVRASKSFDAEGNTVIRVRNGNGLAWRELIRWPAEETGELVAFSSDPRYLYLAATIGGVSQRLLKMDVVKRTYEIIAEDPNYDLGSVMQNPVTHELEAISITRDRLEWQVLDPKVEDDFALLSNAREEMAIISRDLKDRIWIVATSSDRDPGTYLLYDRDTKQRQFLFHVQPKLKQYALAEKQPISFQARDGMRLYAYLTLPVNREAKNLPAVLYVHGGPWTRDDWGFDSRAQWLADRGYVVLQVNYRGSAGYGKAYLNAGDREWAGKMHTDLLDGKNWLIQQGYADPKKVAIFGGSYGGYATLVGLAFTPEEFCCGVDIVGPSNLITLAETIPPYWGPFKVMWNKRVGNPETEREFLESRSPLFKADRIVRPLFIAQGANDPRVKQSESDQIVAALRLKGKKVEYLLFPDEGHGFVRPENRLKFFAEAEVFLHKYLGGSLER